MYQESRFNSKAKPPRKKLLWVIPWMRPTSAYGYTQALDQTWKVYQRSTGSSNDRDEFKAATDFVGWYADQANRRAKIPKYDAYNTTH